MHFVHDTEAKLVVSDAPAEQQPAEL
jgi:hypothetical protein